MGGRRAYFELAPESKKTLENSANMIKIEATAGKRPSCRSLRVMTSHIMLIVLLLHSMRIMSVVTWNVKYAWYV